MTSVTLIAIYRIADPGKDNLPPRCRLPCVKGGFRRVLVWRCARRFRPHPSLRATFPTRGEGFIRSYIIYYALLLNRADQSAMYLTVTNSRKQPSPGWGRWRRRRRMRAKPANATAHGFPPEPSPGGGRRLRAVWGRGKHRAAQSPAPVPPPFGGCPKWHQCSPNGQLTFGQLCIIIKVYQQNHP